jgi:hypothetical protein
VVALDAGGLLLQPQSITPRINKLDTTFIFVSMFNRMTVPATAYRPNDYLIPPRPLSQLIRCLIPAIEALRLANHPYDERDEEYKGRPIRRLTASGRALTYRHHGAPRVLFLDVGPGLPGHVPAR